MNCPICDDKLTPETAVNTECGHSFCKTCFWKWTKANNTCALCRHSILANSEELKEHQHIKQMLGQRTELSRQVRWFQEKLNWLKNEVNTTGKVLNKIEHGIKNNSNDNINNDTNNDTNNSNRTIIISTPELNRRRMESIYKSINSH